jgi:glycosyltransferase involved in cell wall biosynthesis
LEFGLRGVFVVTKYPSVSVIICALNEEQNLPHVLPRIPAWVNEVILVDGHSTDATVVIAKQVRPDIRIVFQPGSGKGDALKCGIQQATSEIIVTLDADGQTNPEDIQRFITPLLSGYDFAKGTRLAHSRPPNMARHRWFGNKILANTANILYGTRYTDICSGYCAYWKSAFERLKLSNNGFGMEQELMVKAKKAGLEIIEVEHYDAGRLGSNSKVSGIKQGFIDFWIIIKNRF